MGLQLNSCFSCEQKSLFSVTLGMKTDYLIIGQGLAGTLLGFELMKAGQRVIFIDSASFQKSSEIAAGLVNPVVFRRLTKSWLVDDLFPKLEETYAELEELLGQKVFYPMKIRKVFGEGEGTFWKKKAVENQLETYLSSEPDYSQQPFLNLPHGCGWVEKGGRVDLPCLLNVFRSYLQKNQLLIGELFDFEKLNISEDAVQYGEVEARKIIFCEGHRVSQNPNFTGLKLKHTKGEVLELRIDNYQSDNVLNKAFFLMPVGNQTFRVGATYDWDNLNEEPTTEGKAELMAKLGQVFTDTFSVEGHKAGIRPTTHDRRPVVGLHPYHPAIGIFNGLGSKGCMLGPYFASQFANYLTGKSNYLHSEVDVARYYRNK